MSLSQTVHSKFRPSFIQYPDEEVTEADDVITGIWSIEFDGQPFGHIATRTVVPT